VTLPEPVQAVVDSRYFVAAVVFVLTQLYNYIAKPYIDKAASNFVPFVKKRFLMSLKDDYLTVCEYKLGIRDSSLENTRLILSTISNLIIVFLSLLIAGVVASPLVTYSDNKFKEIGFIISALSLSALQFTSLLRERASLTARIYIYRNFDELQKKFDELGISLNTEHDR
jgi:hypothetical protein